MRLDEISIIPSKQVDVKLLKAMQKYKIVLTTDGFDIIADFMIPDDTKRHSINCGKNSSIVDAIEQVVKYVSKNG